MRGRNICVIELCTVNDVLAVKMHIFTFQASMKSEATSYVAVKFLGWRDFDRERSGFLSA